MFKLSPNTLAFEVKARHYGTQHLGISPKGASDQLSFEVASILLGNPQKYHCVEILYHANITFTKEVLFTLSGAHFKTMTLLQNSAAIALEHTKVYRANSGDRLHVKEASIGFRLYLFATPLHQNNVQRIGLKRGAYEKWFPPFSHEIPLIRGPEHHLLTNPSELLNTHWKISSSSDLMGLRLQGTDIHAKDYDIISSAVNDGTIQLTSKGPIILMRHHQTTGGYPRVYQVASVAIDRLAQYPLGSSIHFIEISMQEAKALYLEQMKALEAFKKTLLD
ncbi:MAG: hypothetical protein U9N52_09080 [Campylobacterota bacterium]|nr:hypothetical protein [Campylobacterota bacterium]